MDAVILARVSSQEQKDGKSLPAQTGNTQNYAKNKSSKVEEKQQIINLILWNLKLKNKTLEFSYRKPFNLMKDLKNYTL